MNAHCERKHDIADAFVVMGRRCPQTTPSPSTMCSGAPSGTLACCEAINLQLVTKTTIVSLLCVPHLARRTSSSRACLAQQYKRNTQPWNQFQAARVITCPAMPCRFFIILGPTSREGPLRLLAVGKKRLPQASKHER